MKRKTLLIALLMTAATAGAADLNRAEVQQTFDPRGARELFHLQTDDSLDGFSTRSVFNPPRERVDLMFGVKPIPAAPGSENDTSKPVDVGELQRSQALLEIVLADRG